MDVLFQLSFFSYYKGVNRWFEHKKFRNNFLLSVCCCLDDIFFLREKDQKVKFGWIIDFGDSYLDFMFCCSKVFRLQALLHEIDAAARSHSGKRPGYFYMVIGGSKLLLLRHVTGILFCLFAKLFLPSVSNYVPFWSSMSGIVMDSELLDENIIKQSIFYWWE